MLGGRRAFAEGGWGGTPVGDVLPVVIENGTQAAVVSSRSCRRGRRAPARVFPVTQIAETEEASTTKWDNMPQVSTVNPIREVKPGATTLLSAPSLGRQDQVVLAYQRYGRGKTIAMPDSGFVGLEDGREGAR